MRPARLPLTAVLAAALTTALAAGCAAPAPGEDAEPAPASAAAPGSATASTGAAAAPALPWPARSEAEATGLQQAVDAGAQPWLLDPEETALSYAAAAFGWTTATTERTAPGTVVVTGPGGARRTLTLVQPVRPGDRGIWSVTDQA